jgi:hypothetical protein
MTNKIFLIGSILVVVTAITFGILLTGGPFQARIDRFDKLRYNNLVYIAVSLTCDRKPNKPLPDLPGKLKLSSFADYCQSIFIQDKALIDNETGEPYKYTRINSREFKVCAEFHDAARARKKSIRTYRARIRFDTNSGCIHGKLQ